MKSRLFSLVQRQKKNIVRYVSRLVVCAVLEIKSHKQCCSCSLASPIPIWCLLSLMFFMLLSRGEICAVYKFKLQRWSRADGSQWKYNYGKGSNEHDNHSKQSISCKMVTQFGGQNGPVEKHLGGSLMSILPANLRSISTWGQSQIIEKSLS